MLHRAVLAAVAALFILAAVPAAPAAAASNAKVVVVVGPVGSYTAHYKSDADAIVTEARRYTSNVVKLYTPGATWSKVRAAAQGASVFVYLGHGNGWPSIYAPWQTVTKDGLGLDPSTGADSTKVVYYGEDYVRQYIRFAPNSVVLLYHLCYASGNTEPGLSQGTFAQARERVDNYGAGFIGAGARAVFAEGHPAHPVVDYIRQLFTTTRSMNQIFRAAPTWHGHLSGPYPSQRTPGLRFEMDSDTSTPSGFYRSLIGDLMLPATAVTGPRPANTGTNPAAFVVPGAAEVSDPAGAGLFDTAEAAADPAGVPVSTLATATKLRLVSEAPPAADGTRIFATTVLGGSTAGFVRSTGIAPRDSADTVFWSFDQSNAWLSPNGDGLYDQLVLTPRFSEAVAASYTVKNASGTTVKSGSITGDITRFAWDLRDSAGTLVPDGGYTWTVRGRDAWGNAAAVRTGSFTVDHTPPTTTATPTSTTGGSGWIVSPVNVTLAATDALSGVSSISWRVNGGATRAYSQVATVTTNGTVLFEYRATDKAGIVEPWKSLTFRIDTKAPTVSVAYAGVKGDTAGTWRGPVTVTPTFADASSGVASRTVVIDGGPAAPLSSPSVMVDGDGPHTVTFGATDAAGNAMQQSVQFLIDTVAPALATPTPPDGASPPQVTPNGDGVTETVAFPFTASEPVTVTGVVTAADATVVRTLTATVAAGDQSIAWNGRDASGRAVPDGEYTVTLTGRDPAGNSSAPTVAMPVTVYGALAGLTRTPTLFYPQDGDTLAAKAKASWTLVTPASVTVQVLSTAGAVVRTAYTAKALPAGAASWTWDGRRDDGTFPARGTYRIVVTATNGTQTAVLSTTVFADAFKLTTSVATAVRGSAFTITARTIEPLSTTPGVVIMEPGLTARTVTMTKVNTTTWTVRITPRTTATVGTLSLRVSARDSLNGYNSSTVRLALK